MQAPFQRHPPFRLHKLKPKYQLYYSCCCLEGDHGSKPEYNFVQEWNKTECGETVIMFPQSFQTRVYH